MPSSEELKFLSIAIQQKYVTKEQFEECQQAHKTLTEMGVNESLEHILLKKGYLTTVQIKEIYKAIGVDKKAGVSGYEIIEKLGEGSYGPLFKAKQTSVDRIVALKILSPEVAKDPAKVAKFEEYSKTLAKLNHPNIVGLVDAGESDGYHYIAMEMIEGINLGDLVREEKKLPEKEATEIVYQIAKAFEEVASHGLYHGWFSPHDVLITENREVKLTGFGSTDYKVKRSEGSYGDMPYYASPEMATRDAVVDIRADMYSLGIIYYELLTGRVPFRGKYVLQIMKKHIHNDLPDPLKLSPDLSKKTLKVLAGLLAKFPEERFQTPSQLVSAISMILGKTVEKAENKPASDIGKPLPKKKPKRREPEPEPEPEKSNAIWVVGGAVLALILIVVLYFAFSPSPPNKGTQNGETPTPSPVEQLESKVKETWSDKEYSLCEKLVQRLLAIDQNNKVAKTYLNKITNRIVDKELEEVVKLYQEKKYVDASRILIRLGKKYPDNTKIKTWRKKVTDAMSGHDGHGSGMPTDTTKKDPHDETPVKKDPHEEDPPKEDPPREDPRYRAPPLGGGMRPGSMGMMTVREITESELARVKDFIKQDKLADAEVLIARLKPRDTKKQLDEQENAINKKVYPILQKARGLEKEEKYSEALNSLKDAISKYGQVKQIIELNKEIQNKQRNQEKEIVEKLFNDANKLIRKYKFDDAKKQIEDAPKVSYRAGELKELLFKLECASDYFNQCANLLENTQPIIFYKVMDVLGGNKNVIKVKIKGEESEEPWGASSKIDTEQEITILDQVHKRRTMEDNFNFGILCILMKQKQSAIKYLKVAKDQGSEDADKYLGELGAESDFVKIKIITNPSGAEVKVDGVKKGNSPIFVTMKKGKKIRIQLHKEEYKNISKYVTISARKKELSFNLESNKQDDEPVAEGTECKGRDGMIMLPELPGSGQRLCIDKYEFPNMKGNKPRVNISFVEAKKFCKNQGKFLCDERQWMYACLGMGMMGTKKYPYGDNYDASKCNTKINPGTVKTAGSFSNCKTPTGIYDMSGNVAEWIDGAEAKTMGGGVLTNPAGGNVEAMFSCRQNLKYDTGGAGRQDVGFRCCARPRD